MSSYVVVWSITADVPGNNVTDFDSEADANEFAEHLLRVNNKYSVMVCKVVSYHISEGSNNAR